MKRILTSAALGLYLVALFSGVAAGYDVPVDKQISISGSCQPGENLRTTVVDSKGAPVVGQLVTWEITSSPSAADDLRDHTTTTNDNGVTTNSIDVDSTTSGKRVITVTAKDASASITLDCGESGLPRTDTAPAAPILPALGLSVATIMAFAGIGVYRRRIRR